jgi:hypothetical protein
MRRRQLCFFPKRVARPRPSTAKSRRRPVAKCASASIRACAQIAPPVRCRRSGSLSRLATAPCPATLKATNVKQRLEVELPAFVAFYRADQDFNNDDRLELEVSFAAGRKQILRFALRLQVAPMRASTFEPRAREQRGVTFFPRSTGRISAMFADANLGGVAESVTKIIAD